MRNFTPIFTLLLAVTAMMFSCKAIYQPNMVNTPLLKEKNELKLSAGNNNVQAAYAIKDHVGLMANGYFRTNIESDSLKLNITKTRGQLFEVGAGYFKSFNHIVIEGYGGFGTGIVRIDEDHKDSVSAPILQKHFDCTALKIFVQPSVGFVHEYFDIAFTPRISFLKYGTPTMINYTKAEQDANRYTGVNNSVIIFFEPALTLRAGYKFVKVYYQFGSAYHVAGQVINFDKSINYLGLQIDIAKWYKSKDK